ncbi:MAG: PorP/SprF family type IX secretion system membrane protein [Bacteroidales bacterium]|nr:PorP/SprF family type IX secretion system membrane protein [Bacteroidales bacterium]
MKRLLIIAVVSLIANVCSMAQNDLIVGQYIHNQFAVNPAFAGCRDGLTIFGSWRKQLVGIENTPMSMLLTAHAPMKKENITLGLQVWNQTIHESQNTGAEVEIGYRFNVTEKSWLSFALLPGVSLKSNNWSKVHLINPNDDAFAENTSNVTPLLGFGMAWYGRQFFVGASVTSLFVSDDFDRYDAEFAPADAQYVFTGGYMFNVGSDFKVQPSVMANYSKKNDVDYAATLTGIWRNLVWLDAAYTSKNEMSFGAAYQINPRLRVAYNYGLTTGDLTGYSSGSHEISLQYDFVYRVKAVNPKFF